jgi:hypothetical protein
MPAIALGCSVALVACGGSAPKRPSIAPARLLGKPPAGLRYKRPDGATIQQVLKTLTVSATAQGSSDIAVRRVDDRLNTVGLVVVVSSHGESADGIFTGFRAEAKKAAGAEAVEKQLSGARVVQVEVPAGVITAAVEKGFILESIGHDKRTSEALLTVLLRRAASVPAA